jgi:putative ABC transport system ATP-binding protein
VAPLVQIENVSKHFESLHALDGVSLNVESGEWVAIMGPSGSGKTTLINILGGLDRPTGGRVLVDGIEVSKLGEAELTRYRSETIGFIFQQFHLVPYLTALENVMLAQYFHSITDEAQAAESLKRVGLGDRLTHLPAELSGGEQQRVAIARALINQPKLILADEPTGNLDEANEQIVLNLLRELHAAGHTIIIVTHSPMIGGLVDRRIELAHGHVARETVPVADDQVRFDHLLEQVWICGEEGLPASVERVRTADIGDATPFLQRLADLGLVEIRDAEVRLTSTGGRRAQDVVRRHRLAECLLTNTFAISDAEAHSEACKFEHIISPELDRKICTFLGHPNACPHGNPIPPGDCCATSAPRR